ncbi:hypothetical protein SCLCIDRAFT_1148720 [Scleroderma citrinum Foug A]|uniref:Uncharacterized protein n=1 Tax=Scleroderma citrinum Foug A TaxID=1036808 RepID=A0A0C3D591_9AGAM|nr:hypothetical protein SCLCIDRAFT_1148720 [Scleroderma citrinum Foug A]
MVQRTRILVPPWLRTWLGSILVGNKKNMVMCEDGQMLRLCDFADNERDYHLAE